MHTCILVVIPSLTLRSHVFTMKYSSTSGMIIYIYTYVRSIIFSSYIDMICYLNMINFPSYKKNIDFLMNRD